MEFKFGHLADYAGEGANGKLILVGIFETVFAAPPRPITLPSLYVVAVFEAHVTEGTRHQLEIRFTDADGGDVFPRGTIPINFAPQGPRQPLRANVIANMVNLRVPDVGDYSFHLFVDGHRYAEIPLRVAPHPAADQAGPSAR